MRMSALGAAAVVPVPATRLGASAPRFDPITPARGETDDDAGAGARRGPGRAAARGWARLAGCLHRYGGRVMWGDGVGDRELPGRRQCTGADHDRAALQYGCGDARGA